MKRKSTESRGKRGLTTGDIYMKKIALLIMLITVVSKVFGFAREVTLSYYYGASELTDVYLISQTIPGSLFGFFGAAISTTFIPMYSKIKNDMGESSADRFMSKLLNIVLVLAVLLIAVIYLQTPQIIKLFAIGFKGATLDLAVIFTRVSVIGVLATGTIAILTAYLQIKNRFVIPALIGLPMNLAVIAAIIISSKTTVNILIWGSLTATFLQLLFILPSVFRLGYRHNLSLSFSDKYVKALIVLSLPVLLGSSVNQINTIVDRTLASSITIGGISALNYATRLNGFVLGLLVSSIAIVIYPPISRMAAEGRREDMKILIKKSVISILILILPATVGSMVLSKPIVRMLFGQGVFDERATVLTSGALFFYSIGLAAFGVREVLLKAFYALQDTKTPMYNGALSVLINIILNIILARVMGLSGLALATSISAIVCSLLLLWSLRNKIGPLGLHEIFGSTIKSLIACAAMGVVVYVSYFRLTVNLGQTKGLLVSISLGVLSYCVLIIGINVPEVREIVWLARTKFKREIY